MSIYVLREELEDYSSYLYDMSDRGTFDFLEDNMGVDIEDYFDDAVHDIVDMYGEAFMESDILDKIDEINDKMLEHLDNSEVVRTWEECSTEEEIRELYENADTENLAYWLAGSIEDWLLEHPSTHKFDGLSLGAQMTAMNRIANDHPCAFESVNNVISILMSVGYAFDKYGVIVDRSAFEYKFSYEELPEPSKANALKLFDNLYEGSEDYSSDIQLTIRLMDEMGLKFNILGGGMLV